MRENRLLPFMAALVVAIVAVVALSAVASHHDVVELKTQPIPPQQVVVAVTPAAVPAVAVVDGPDARLHRIPLLGRVRFALFPWRYSQKYIHPRCVLAERRGYNPCPAPSPVPKTKTKTKTNCIGSMQTNTGSPSIEADPSPVKPTVKPPTPNDPPPKPAPTAKPRLVDDATVQAMFNTATKLRVQNHLPKQNLSGELCRFAREHAQQMAASGRIKHSKGGYPEVIGTYTDVHQTFNAWMLSRKDRKIILGPYEVCGFGHAKGRDGTLYFCGVMSGKNKP